MKFSEFKKRVLRGVLWGVFWSVAWGQITPGRAEDSPWPDVSCTESMPSSFERTQRISRIRQVMLEALVRTEPYAGSNGSGLFAGNYDWHSSVHGHWALLSIARLTQDAALEALLLDRLKPQALERERVYLSEHPQFELPYGQSWLLVMLEELSRRPEVAKSEEFKRLRSETRSRVLSWLEKSPFPESGGLIGTHNSWLFSYLLTQISARKDKELQMRLYALWKSKIRPAREAISQFKPDDWDFLDLAAVLATADKVTPKAKAKPVAVGEAVALKSPITSWNAHTAGAAMVRIWPYGMQSKKDPRACARYHSRMNEMFARPDQWRDGFETVSHWVPQFMWMGMWLEMGRP